MIVNYVLLCGDTARSEPASCDRFSDCLLSSFRAAVAAGAYRAMSAAINRTSIHEGLAVGTSSVLILSSIFFGTQFIPHI